MNNEVTARGALAHLLDGLEHIRNRLRSPAVQRVAFLCAAVVFGGGVIISLRASPDLLAKLKPMPVLLLTFVFAPILIVLNTLLLLATCKIAAAKMSLINGLKLSILSSAANYLPLPGGPALRIVAMAESGATLKNASLANIAAALLWFGVTFLHAGFWAFPSGSMLFIFLLAIGLTAFVAGISLTRLISKNFFDMIVLTVISLLTAICYATGFWFALRLIGFDGGFAQAVIISIAGVIGAAASFAPAGLGVRELAAAYVASLVATAPALGFLASAMLQVVTIAPLVFAAIILSLNSRPREAKTSAAMNH